MQNGEKRIKRRVGGVWRTSKGIEIINIKLENTGSWHDKQSIRFLRNGG